MGLALTFDSCSFLKNVAEENTRVLYSLYGVVEHSGTMRSGHYTAYAKARSANSHLSNLVLHGDILQGKKEVLQNSGIQQIFMAKPKKDELESFHLYI